MGALRFLPAALLALAAAAYADPVKNGFDLEGASIPPGEILQGGPPRDGIPAIDDPQFESAEQANWLDEDSPVIGVERWGTAKAYPILILNWHEIVNDTVAGDPVLVTFCPLCGTGIVFAPPPGDRLDFGVSGLLYNSDVLLYDRQSESLWSQILAEAVAGPRRGETLEVLPSQHTSWGRWREQHPDTLVLARKTGHRRDYGRNPYAGYEDSPNTFFPLANNYEGELHSKERVLGIVAGGSTKAYPFAALEANGQESFTDTVGGEQIVVRFDPAGPAAWAETPAGEPRKSMVAFWFAWYAFYPETEIFQ